MVLALMMSFLNVLKIPFVWGFFGLAVGAIFGAEGVSVWIIAVMLSAFLLFMKFSGPARDDGEGSLFAGGGLLMVAWIVGFMLRGVFL